MCRGLRVEIATDGSFCRCKYGSPPGNCVPETMFVFCPGVWAETASGATSSKQSANRTNGARMGESPGRSEVYWAGSDARGRYLGCGSIRQLWAQREPRRKVIRLTKCAALGGGRRAGVGSK